MGKTIWTLAAAAAVGGLTAFGVVRATLPSTDNTDTKSVLSSRTVNLENTDYPDFTYAAESSVDAVVYVQVVVRQKDPYADLDPFLKFFFGMGGNSRSREQVGSGSGVIISDDGYIVTNNHVVAGATSIGVTLNNNETYEARIVGTDPATDVALLKVDATALPHVDFGDSDALRLGEWVLAIGSPLGSALRGTITAGIVSAKGRSMPSQDPRDFKIESFIQTDAAVNPGNSGGALMNKRGELVGINTAIISQTGAYSGYSFAVPANIVKKIVADIIEFGKVQRVMLGVKMASVNDAIAKNLKLSSTNGVYISEVVSGSAASKAGILPGDVIVEIGGTSISTAASIQEKINSYRPGDTASVTVIREGERKLLQLEFSPVDESGK